MSGQGSVSGAHLLQIRHRIIIKPRQGIKFQESVFEIAVKFSYFRFYPVINRYPESEMRSGSVIGPESGRQGNVATLNPERQPVPRLLWKRLCDCRRGTRGIFAAFRSSDRLLGTVHPVHPVMDPGI